LDARLAENEARLAEQDALVATLAEELDVAVKGNRQEQDQETGPNDQPYQQPAAEEAQRQNDMQATAGADAAPAATNRRGTFVQPLMGGEKKIYHTNGTIEFETVDGERMAEDEFCE